jgi:hypothetical protein
MKAWYIIKHNTYNFWRYDMKNGKYAGFFVITALVMILAFSCAITDSGNVKTSGIWVSYTVRHKSDTNIEVIAVFRVGGPLGTLLEMSDGEYISCNGVALSWATLYYYTTFTSPAPGNVYTFTFHRTDETIDTEVTVPPSPGTVTTTPSDGYNEWDPLEVNWSSGLDTIEIEITGTEIDTYTRSGITDDGSFIVNDPKGTGIESDNNAGVSSLDVLVKKYRTGSVNAVYEGGQTRSEHWASSATVTNFQPKLTLEYIINPEDSGTVTAVGSVSGTTYSGEYGRYEIGESVTLTAEGLMDWNFLNWSGDISSSDNPHTIPSITSGVSSITANFQAK